MEKSLPLPPVYQVLACSLDYSKCLSVFCSENFEQCVSVATTLYRGSKLAVYKIVDESDTTLVSYLRVGHV